MRAIVQRVAMANVMVDGREVGRCGFGLLLLVGIHRDDDESHAKKLADRVAKLRIFNDPEGKMNLSALDFPADQGFETSILAVSNFTVYGETAKNRRPSFVASAGFEQGRALFDRFIHELRAYGLEVQTGVFGAHMRVSLVNDGPVTVTLDV